MIIVNEVWHLTSQRGKVGLNNSNEVGKGKRKQVSILGKAG